MNNKIFIRFPLQFLNYSVFMGLVWYFSILPPYHQLEDNQALITFTMSHIGKHIVECKKVSYEELMKLPPNMRKPMDCPRERSPVVMELKLNGEVYFSHTAEPLGLYSDQGIDIYKNLKVPAGKHNIQVWLNDDVKVEGPIYELQKEVMISPEQHLIVQFEPGKNGFTIK